MTLSTLSPAVTIFQYDLDIISAIPDLDVVSGLTTPGSFDPAAILDLIAGAPDRNRLADASSCSLSVKNPVSWMGIPTVADAYSDHGPTGDSGKPGAVPAL